MVNAIQLSPTRWIRYEIGLEEIVIDYLRRAGTPPHILAMLNIQLAVLAAVAAGRNQEKDFDE